VLEIIRYSFIRKLHTHSTLKTSDEKVWNECNLFENYLLNVVDLAYGFVYKGLWILEDLGNESACNRMGHKSCGNCLCDIGFDWSYLMVSVETVANWYGINIPTDGFTDATPYVRQVSEIDKATKENSMSEKFKIGDIVSPNVDYFWSDLWKESEIVNRDNAGWKIKNKEGHVGTIAVEKQWDVVKFPNLGIGSKYVIANPKDTILDGVDACEIIGIYDGHYIIEFNDGEITRAWKVGNENDFLDCWKLYKEPETITRWTYVYNYDYEAIMDDSIYSTEQDAIDDCAEFGFELIKTIKIEYTPE